jgi:putative ABC transport system permease protein
MNTLSLAFRNVLRNRRRSLTTLIAMVIGMASVLLFGGYSRNVTYGLQTSYVQRSGHLQIQRKNYFLYGNGNPAAYGIRDYGLIIEAVKSDPQLASMLTVITPTLQVSGIAGNFSAGVSRTVMGTGVEVDGQNRLRQWDDYSYFQRSQVQPAALTHTGADAAVIGNGVARVLQLCDSLKVKPCELPPADTATPAGAAPLDAPSDVMQLSSDERASTAPRDSQVRIELLAANAHGAPNVARLQVVRAEDHGVKELDDVALTMHLRQAQQLVYGDESPRVTAIVLQLQHTGQQAAAKARLKELLMAKFPSEPLDVQDFQTLNPFYGQSIGMFAAIFAFISVLIGAIVLFSVGNTMSMAIVERTTEIGTLRAIGLRRVGVRTLFVAEALMLGCIGAVLGVLISLAIAWGVNQAGLTWLPPGRVEPVALNLRVWGEPWLIFGTALALIKVATVSAWWPARRAAKMNIVDALRHV